MSDNILLNDASVPGGKTLRTKDFGGLQHELIINEYLDSGGNPVEVTELTPLPVKDEVTEQALTDIAAGTAASLGQKLMVASVPIVIASDQSAIPVTGSFTPSGTQDTNEIELAGTAIDVNSGNKSAGTQRIVIATDQPQLTNPLKVDGSGVTQPISAAALPLPVGAAIAANQQTDALTNTQLRLTPVPVSISSGGGGAVTIADGADVAEGATADAIVAAGAAGTVSAKLRRATQDIGSIDGKTPALGQALAAASTPVVLTAAEETILSAILTIADFDTKTGSLTETAPATDTASSGLNGRLQRIAQRLTSLITLLPAALGAGGGLKIDGSGTALPVSGTVTVDTSALLTTSDFDTKTGSLTETAPATDTASSGLNGRLQRIAQRISSLITALGSPFQAGGSIGNTSFAATQATAANLNMTEASAAAILAKLTAAAASFVKLEDVASVDADAGVGMLAVRKATPANTSGSDGDYEFLQMNGGKLWVQAGATQKPSIGATSVLAVTALQSMGSSATVGWKSVRTSNLATLANDYEVFISLTTAASAPANDKAVYLFVIPWYTTDAGSTWFASSGGTATLPTSVDATYTIASPHNFRLLGVLNYTTQSMTLQDTFLLSNCFGNRLPDGFSFCVINFSGAALGTGCVLDISPINDILV